MRMSSCDNFEQDGFLLLGLFDFFAIWIKEIITSIIDTQFFAILLALLLKVVKLLQIESITF